MTQEQLAQAIFDSLRESDVYTFNDDIRPLNIGVDGYVDCNELAKAILARME